MEKLIKFIHHDLPGEIVIDYNVNTDPISSGFYLLKDLPFDRNRCIGYPTMHARVKNFKGTGYAMSCSWIQLIYDKCYEYKNVSEYEEYIDVDVSKEYKLIGNPFFAQGYPASIYDAPCYNIGNYAKLEWTAHTFLVTTPNRMNNNKVKFICGFEWGYTEERNEDDSISVTIKDLTEIKIDYWKTAKKKLTNDFPVWKYE